MKPLLNINKLTKTYGDIKACNNINFDLYPGQVLGIIGESGSGKSTLLNCIGSNLSLVFYYCGHQFIGEKSNLTLNLS